MPWCPKCGAEYRDGFTRCASCDVPLVDRLTDEQSKEANKSETERECDKMVLPEGMSSPIAVYTAKNRLEAESIEEMLRDNDIPVFDRPAAFRQIQSYSGADARFGVELVVDASQTVSSSSRCRLSLQKTSFPRTTSPVWLRNRLSRSPRQRCRTIRPSACCPSSQAFSCSRSSCCILSRDKER